SCRKSTQLYQYALPYLGTRHQRSMPASPSPQNNRAGTCPRCLHCSDFPPAAETPVRLCSCSYHPPLRISVILDLFDPVRNSRISLANVVEAADLVRFNDPCDSFVAYLHNLPQGVKQRSCCHVTNKDQ